MKHAFKELPQNLQGKVIAITGILPGAGKSFSKRQIVKCLRNNGYTVRSLGTTQVASDDQTLCSYLRLYDVNEGIFKKYSDVRKSHPNTKAFLIIDEAWMSNQEMIDALQEDFPKCCIILIGDPSQLKGPEKDVNQIWRVDNNIILEGSHRSSDERLIKFLNDLREGSINFDLLKTRIRNPNEKEDMFISYIKSDRDNYNEIVGKEATERVGGLVFSLKGIPNGNKMIFFPKDKEWTKSWKNMQLWRITRHERWGVDLESITSEETITNLDLSTYYKYFHNATAVNINKIQGVTLRDQTISIEPFLDQKYIDILRQLYVMCSRVTSWDQISIPEHFYNKLYNKCHKHLTAPLSMTLSSKVAHKMNSDEFKDISLDKLFNILYEDQNGVGLDQSRYNISATFNKPTPTSQFNGGRGNKKDISRSDREYVVKHLKRGNLDINNLSEDQLTYLDTYLNKYPELGANLHMKYTTEMIRKYKMPVCQNTYSPSSATVHDDDQFIITAEYLEDTTIFDKKGEHMRPVCFAYESDNLPKEDQLKMMLALPKTYIFSITDSGNKSIHTLVYIDEKWRDEAKEHIKDYWRAVGEKLFGDNMKYMDASCATVARLSRLPGGRRDNGNEQTCYFLNRKPIGICLDEFTGAIVAKEAKEARKAEYIRKKYENMKERPEIKDAEEAFRNMCIAKNTGSSLLALEIYESGIAEKGSVMIGAIKYAKGIARHHPELEDIARQIYYICHKQHPSNIGKRYEEI